MQVHDAGYTLWSRMQFSQDLMESLWRIANLLTADPGVADTTVRQAFADAGLSIVRAPARFDFTKLDDEVCTVAMTLSAVPGSVRPDLTASISRWVEMPAVVRLYPPPSETSGYASADAKGGAPDAYTEENGPLADDTDESLLLFAAPDVLHSDDAGQTWSLQASDSGAIVIMGRPSAATLGSLLCESIAKVVRAASAQYGARAGGEGARTSEVDVVARETSEVGQLIQNCDLTRIDGTVNAVYSVAKQGRQEDAASGP